MHLSRGDEFNCGCILDFHRLVHHPNESHFLLLREAIKKRNRSMVFIGSESKRTHSINLLEDPEIGQSTIVFNILFAQMFES